MTNILISCLFKPANRVTRWQRNLLLSFSLSLSLSLAIALCRELCRHHMTSRGECKNQLLSSFFLQIMQRNLNRWHIGTHCRCAAAATWLAWHTRHKAHATWHLALSLKFKVRASLRLCGLAGICWYIVTHHVYALSRCPFAWRWQKKITIIVIYAYLNMKCVNWQATRERDQPVSRGNHTAYA